MSLSSRYDHLCALMLAPIKFLALAEHGGTPSHSEAGIKFSLSFRLEFNLGFSSEFNLWIRLSLRL